MLKLCGVVVLALTALEACTHHGAVRVPCEGPLRPINRPEGAAPVSVEPATVLPPDESRQP